MNRLTLGIALTILPLAYVSAAQQPQNTPQGALRIVVLEGEDAVNIIQQKTAVRPVVEVRDSNDLPIAGVTVRFAVQSGTGGGTATFGSQSVATVTTNAAGRAAAPQMQVAGSGAFRIDVQASYQGRLGTATINQTNYLTAADVPPGSRAAGRAESGSLSSSAVSTAGVVAGAGAAALGGVLAAKQATDLSCDATKNEALDELEIARTACSSRSSSCEATAQRAASALGNWCSCGSRATVDATIRGAHGVGLAELAAAGVLVNVALPSSCQ